MFENSKILELYQFRMSVNTESINFSSEMSIAEKAQWYSLFNKITPGNITPEINLNPPPPGVSATAAIMYAADKMDEIWEPYTEEKLSDTAHIYYANILDETPLNLNIPLEQLAQSICEHRYLTRQELILVMKCDYLEGCRQNAIFYGWSSEHPNNIKKCAELNKHCVCNYMK